MKRIWNWFTARLDSRLASFWPSLGPSVLKCGTSDTLLMIGSRYFRERRRQPYSRTGSWALSQSNHGRQHRLYFFPLPQGQGSLRPILPRLRAAATR